MANLKLNFKVPTFLTGHQCDEDIFIIIQQGDQELHYSLNFIESYEDKGDAEKWKQQEKAKSIATNNLLTLAEKYPNAAKAFNDRMNEEGGYEFDPYHMDYVKINQAVEKVLRKEELRDNIAKQYEELTSKHPDKTKDIPKFDLNNIESFKELKDIAKQINSIIQEVNTKEYVNNMVDVEINSHTKNKPRKASSPKVKPTSTEDYVKNMVDAGMQIINEIQKKSYTSPKHFGILNMLKCFLIFSKLNSALCDFESKLDT